MQTERHSLFCFFTFMKPQGFPRHVLRPSQPHSRIWLLVLSLLLIVVVAWPHVGVAQQVQIKQTPVAVQNGTANLVGHYDPEQKLRLVFGLQPPHLAEEEQFLQDLQTPGSPNFQKFLKPEEWNARFSPSAEDEHAVLTWAQSQGLTITHRYPNRLLVDVEATVAIIEKALDVTINRYQLGSTLFYSNDRDPAIPARLAAIVHSVGGLNNLQVLHPANKAAPEPAFPVYVPGPVVGPGSSGGGSGNGAKGPHNLKPSEHSGSSPDITNGAYDPTDMYSSEAYDATALYNQGHCCNPLGNSGSTPPESSIAIATAGSQAVSDMQGFHAQYPYLAYNFQELYIDGTPPCCDGEGTLDLEWSTAWSNSFGSYVDTAKVWLYDGVNAQFSTFTDVYNQILTDGNARVFSTSWGCEELYCTPQSVMDTDHAIFNSMIGQGWTLIAASGDQGATAGCGNFNIADAVQFPSSDPNVVGAGGSTLSLDPFSNYISEVGWTGGPDGCGANDGGSTGGVSAYWPAPAYQGLPSGSYREVPDIALNADWYYTPQNYFFDGILSGNGGTSIVAPEVAGFFAQENAYLLYVGTITGGCYNGGPCAPIGNGNWYLYWFGLNPGYAPHYPFYDITSGCNNNDITRLYGLNYYCAGPGYDMVTGWGSANMLQLAWAINTYRAGDFGAPVVKFSGPVTNHWYNTDQIVIWTVADTSANGNPPTGVAGFSQAWDFDPGDVFSEPTPGAGNSFYSGPQYPNATNGCLDFTGTSCAGSVGQGWHTVNVRAWDNTGVTSGDYTYGPIGYDTVPPVTVATLSGTLQGGIYVSPVQVTLTATDNASGAAATYYEVDGGAWQIYTGSFTVAANGNHTVGFYSVDLAGNVETTKQVNFAVNLNNTYYSLSVYLNPTSGGTVTSTDGYINCPGSCGYSYLKNTPVTLNAAPAQGWTFTGWSGACSGTGSCKMTMTRNQSVTATFTTPGGALQFVPVVPCRVVDTRNPDGPFGGPSIKGQTERDFSIPPGACNIPATAAAYSLNVTVVPKGTLGYLTIWPAGESQPLVSTLNSYDGRVKANAAIVPAGASQAVSVYVTNTTDVLLDIDGYFTIPSQQTLQFYPLTPCRVADTRDGTDFASGLGPPYLMAQVERDFPVLNAANNKVPCNIPSSAQAYSLNFTAVPHGFLGYLTVWPTGQSQPVVSTLNAYGGQVTANAAIVPAGNDGKVSTYALDDTDLLIDINGYFAAPGQGGGLSLYPVVPCRVLDTRPHPFQFELSPPVDVLGSVCAPSSQSQAYVFNATVVPQGGLGYLTLWPDGGGQPVVSTLNAYDGAVSSNMAIVPAGNQGKVDAYADPLNPSDPKDVTDLILDISSYFAP
jgi:uncharacterized repeat protein (TIGR02543 family)